MDILGHTFNVVKEKSEYRVIFPINGLMLAAGKSEDDARDNAINALKVAWSIMADKGTVHKAPVKSRGLSQGDAISLCRLFVAKKCTLPVLSNIRVIAKDGMVEYQSTNLESGISIKVPGSGRCDLTVPAGQLVPGDYSVDPKTQSMIIGGLTIKGIDSQEYPPIPDENKATATYSLTLSMLDDLPKVLPAYSKDEARPVLMAVMFLTTSESITGFVAADGFRLQMVGSGDNSVLVPGKSLDKLMRVRKYIKGDVTVKIINNGYILFDCESIKVYSMLVEGKFPDYRQIYPTRNKMPIRITCDSQKVVAALTDLKPIYSAGSNVVRVYMSDKSINLSAFNEEVGKGDRDIDCETSFDPFKKRPQLSAFNGKYLIDAVSQSERVNIWLDRPNTPALIESGNFRAVVMPMHL